MMPVFLENISYKMLSMRQED